MLLSKINKVATIVATLAVIYVSNDAVAGENKPYPSQTINMISTHGAGGDIDYNTRLIARFLEDELDTSIVVNNVPGANGSIALTQYKDEKADGYILVSTLATTFAALETTGIIDYGFDAYEIVAIYGKQCGENILVRADFPVNSLAELIEESKKKPEKLKLGVAIGGVTFITSLIMSIDNGAKFAVVDAGGEGVDRITSLLGGHIDVTIAPFSISKEYIEGGKVKPLCTLMSERLPLYPSIPTAMESGIANLSFDPVFVLLAPKGTPEEICQKLNTAVLKIVYENPEYLKAIRTFNYQEPYALSLEDSKQRLKELREVIMKYAKYFQ